jgi:predicted transcriptional regulator
MAIQLTSDLEHRLEHLAAESQRPVDELAQEILEDYLTYVEVLTEEVREGDESAEREGWLTTEEVFERINKRLHTAA